MSQAHATPDQKRISSANLFTGMFATSRNVVPTCLRFLFVHKVKHMYRRLISLHLLVAAGRMGNDEMACRESLQQILGQRRLCAHMEVEASAHSANYMGGSGHAVARQIT